MLSTLLSQFRQQYPQGSLTSDLLTLHDGLFIVRVCVGVEGTTLACGLGANAGLELAEDLATTRALERLGFATTTSSTLATTAAIAPPPIAPRPKLSTLAPSPDATPSPSLALVASSSGKSSSGESGPGESSPDEPDLDPAITFSELEAAAEALAIPPAAQIIPAPPASPKQDAPLDLGDGALASIDLSDIIAQTDVELQRLGWGVHQGREFLEKTYGKRSRHDLTDDELLEFLLFLETQSPLPNP